MIVASAQSGVSYLAGVVQSEREPGCFLVLAKQADDKIAGRYHSLSQDVCPCEKVGYLQGQFAQIGTICAPINGYDSILLCLKVAEWRDTGMQNLSAAIVGCAVLVLLCPLCGYGEIPEIDAGVYIYDGGAPLEVQTMSAPTVVDWNNDGRKDLVVGHFTQGHISLFLNQGTDASPVFSGGSFIESSGSAITTTYG